MLPDIFLCDSPGVALLAAISISASAMASVRQLHYRDADRAAKLEDISARAQLNAAALLRSLGTAEHDQLLRSRRGTVALLRAAQTGCHIILGRPRMQHSLHTAWAGRYFATCRDGDTPFLTRLLMGLFAPLATVLNLALLPLVCLFPPLDGALQRCMLRVGGDGRALGSNLASAYMLGARR